MITTIEQWIEVNDRWTRLGYSVWANIKGDRFVLHREGYNKYSIMLFVYPYVVQELTSPLKERVDRFLKEGKINWIAVRHGTSGKGNDLFPNLELDKDGKEAIFR